MATGTITRQKVHAVSDSVNSKATAANTWYNTGKTIVVPNYHVYIARITLGWSSQKPIGIGVNNSSTIDGAPTQSVTGDPQKGATFMLPAGTWYVFEMRAGVPTSNNTVYINYIDIPTD